SARGERNGEGREVDAESATGSVAHAFLQVVDGSSGRARAQRRRRVSRHPRLALRRRQITFASTHLDQATRTIALSLSKRFRQDRRAAYSRLMVPSNFTDSPSAGTSSVIVAGSDALPDTLPCS